MKDHEIRELVNELTELVPKYVGTQQLRAVISLAVNNAVANSRAVPLKTQDIDEIIAEAKSNGVLFK